MVYAYQTDADGHITMTCAPEFGEGLPTFDFPADFDFGRQSFWMIENGVLVEDAEMIGEETRMIELTELRKKLADGDNVGGEIMESLVEAMKDATALDFVVKFIAWLVQTVKQYGELLAGRRQWRERIRELEGK